MKVLRITLFLLLFAGTIPMWSQQIPDYTIQTQRGTLVLNPNLIDFDQLGVLSENEVVEGYFYRLLQFYHLPDREDQALLQQMDIHLLNYLPQFSYLAALPTGITAADLEKIGTRAIASIPSDWKLGAGLEDLTDIAPLELILKYYGNLPQEDVLAYCRADGMEVLEYNGSNNFLKVAVPATSLPALADLPYVAYLELAPPPGEPEDDLGRSLHRANGIDTDFPMGRKYTGEGVGVLVRDDGFVGPHIDFHGRINQDVSGDGGINHADGVAGIFAGAGNMDPTNRGMAAGADLYVIDYQANFLDNTMSLHFNNGVLVTNSSYSNGCNDGYTNITETVDQQMYDNPTLLHVFSAGNSNGQNCGYGAGNQWGNITGGHKQGKNVIATANLFATAELVSSSSRGPAYDGRIKPDISANGQDQVSTDPYHTYAGFGGTSGAAPGIAGITAQLHQAYQELNGGEVAESALLKACLLNTANDLGNTGPDFKFGWGHVNAYRAVLSLENNTYLSSTISNNEVNFHSLEVPDGVRQLKVMLYWADKEASAFASTALVNDLDLSLSGPGGTYAPWVLNPSPSPALLDLPATTGADHLNNVEQVLINNPAAGTYSMEINGFQVPFGPQKYYIVYEYLFDEITVTYPAGGEGFRPTEIQRIHWDAPGNTGDFQLSYSTNNGSTWNAVTTVTGDSRFFNWSVPNVVSGQMRIRVSRNGIEGTHAAPFSVIQIPNGINVTQACPDFIRVEWNEVADATGYDVFRLGDRYMDSIGTTTDLFYEVPTLNGDPTQFYWFSVRARGNNNARGRRANAVPFGGGLFNCNLDKDLVLQGLVQPSFSFYSACAPYDQPVKVRVFNGGQEAVSSFSLGLQINNDPPLTASLNVSIEPGATFEYEFTENLQINNGFSNQTIQAWVTSSGDEAAFNDTIVRPINAQVSTGNGISSYLEAFGAPTLQMGLGNPNNDQTWIRQDDVFSANGNTGGVAVMKNYEAGIAGREDVLVTPAINLSNAGPNTVLSFDVAYAAYNANRQDALRVDVYTDCGATFAGTAYFKEGDELATVSATTGYFTPDDEDEWRSDGFGLAPWLGQSVVFHFVNVHGLGNNLYLDNINLLELAPPTAGFTGNTSVCVDKQLLFFNASEGDNLSYQWNFGPGAFPATANGTGPYIVTFTAAGPTTVSLTVENQIGSDLFELPIMVIPEPVAGFDFQDNGGFVAFTNLSIDATEYEWNFGDGNTSTQENPVHAYDESGTYEVTLIADNGCEGDAYSTIVEVVVTAIDELNAAPALQLFPNPNSGTFTIRVTAPGTYRLLDAHGRVVHLGNLQAADNEIRTGVLPTGLYLLEVSQAESRTTHKMIIN